MSRQVEFSSDETVGEAQRLVRDLAGPRQHSDDRASMIARAARRLGWSVRRAKSVWYAECQLRGTELDALRNAAGAQEAEARNVLSELQAAIERAQRILAGAADPPRLEDHGAREAAREERRSLAFLDERI